MNRFEKQLQTLTQHGNDFVHRIKNGENLKDVCKSYGIMYNGSLKILKKFGFDINKRCYIPQKQIIISDDELNQVIFAIKTQGESLRNLSKERNLNYSAYYKAIKNYLPEVLNMKKSSAVRKRQSIGKEKLNFTQEADIVRRYTKDTESSYVIANVYNVSVNTILRILRKHDVELNQQSIYWTNDRRAQARQYMHNRMVSNPRYKDTSIERMFMKFCDDHKILYFKQYQIEDGTHKFDFKIGGTNLLVETDGSYWHSKADQITKDVMFDLYASSHRYKVMRFTDTEIYDTNGECFSKILVYI